MSRPIKRAITACVNAAAHWITVLLVTAYVVAWAATDKPFDNLDFASALSVWMLFAVLHVAVRDGAALQTKIDALILNLEGPPDEVAGIEKDYG